MSLIPIYSYFDLQIKIDSGRSSVDEIFIVGIFEDKEAIAALRVSDGRIIRMKLRDGNEFENKDYAIFCELIEIVKDQIIGKWKQFSLGREPNNEDPFDLIWKLFEEHPDFTRYDLMFDLLKSFCRTKLVGEQFKLFITIRDILKSLEPRKVARIKLKNFKDFLTLNSNLWEGNDIIKELISSDVLFKV